MSSEWPPPPDPSRLIPHITTWPAGRQLVRCHDSRFGSSEFNPGLGAGRFHPFRTGPRRRPIPTLYAAADEVAAASETVFHTVPLLGAEDQAPRAVFLSRYLSWMWSTLVLRRDLHLVDLTEPGLSVLGVARETLSSSPAAAYPVTREWGCALYRASAADGLLWDSRQAPESEAVVLFGARDGRGVRRREITVAQPPVPFADGPGLTLLAEIAERLEVMLVSR